MKFQTVVRVGIAAAAAASAAHTATAQTAANMNAVNLLSPFTGLGSQPSALTSNLGTAVRINGGATAGQIAQALSDNTITGNFKRREWRKHSGWAGHQPKLGLPGIAQRLV